MTALLEQVLTVGAYAGFFAVILGANLFILFYGPFVKWWKKPFGKHLFAFMLVLAASLNHNLATVIWGEYPGVLYVTFVLCWAMAWVVWWRLKILLTVQIGRRHESEPAETSDVPQDSHDSLDGTDGADSSVVEGVDPLGRSDERMG